MMIKIGFVDCFDEFVGFGSVYIWVGKFLLVMLMWYEYNFVLIYG